ncbi:chalcone isomerase family protein [Massilia sp. PAMC28688]|uniref:chalcone isomerase family protein n=1 Tax=Massilia sp. PAMC28688 TaxID=2861283 RepID=UPI001C636781|nr:chalcone isomerase family protein [Massilia sp. PAMC28688]QYF94395.1 chalcone isomerase family protein [Massilia sp. PAMC28688]
MRVLATLLLLCAFTGAHAAAPHIDAHLTAPRVAGQGTFKWFGLTIYHAQLWVGEQGYQPDAPFVLELVYARKLDGGKIAQASAEQMEKIGAGTPAQRTAWLARMREIFPNVQEGTRISGVHLPGSGARFYLDGRPLASVPDPAFARAFFAIWLDPKTTAPALRAALLGQTAPR